jgi:hypothetical protein
MRAKPRTLRLLLAIAAVAFTAGVFSQRSGSLGRLVARLSPRSLAPQPLGDGPRWRMPFVLIAAGQSNAANHGRPPGRAGEGTYALAADGLYPLTDPLPGASGQGGSVWSRWAALRRARHPEQQVVVAAVAQGSSAVADWVGLGAHAKRIQQLLPQLKRQGLNVDAVVWIQGETEAWRPQASGLAYRSALNQWIDSIRSLDISAPIFICLTSRDGNGVINTTIRQAQASTWSESANVYAGVDIDSLGEPFRSDRVHFNERGLNEIAKLLEIAITSRSTTEATGLHVF